MDVKVDDKRKVKKEPKEQPKPAPVREAPGLAALLPALGTIPEHKNIWFDKKLAFAANGHFGIQIPYKGDFAFGVPGDVLVKLLKSATGEVKLEADGDALVVSYGRSHAALQIADLRFGKKIWGFPALPPKSASMWEVTKEMLAAFKRVSSIRGNPATSLLHHGVIALPGKDSWTLYSTDSAALAETHIDAAVPKGMKAVIFPYKFVDAIVEYCQPGDELFVMNDYLAAYGEDITIFSEVIDSSELPDLAETVRRFTSDVKTRAAIPDGLSAALARAKLLHGKAEPLVQLMTNGKELLIKGTKLTHGELQESLPCKLPTAVIKLDADRLANLLGPVKEFALVSKAILLFGPDLLLILVAHGG